MIPYNEIIESNNNSKLKKKINYFKKKKIKCLLNFNSFQLQAYIEF